MEAGPVVANIARMGYQPRKQSLLKGLILGPESNEALSSGKWQDWFRVKKLFFHIVYNKNTDQT